MFNAILLKIKDRIVKPWSSLALLLAIIGPGLITGTADNDAGGITTYSIAGAKFGYSMIWTLVPITILLVYTMNITAKIAVVTRLGLAELIREKFRIKLTLWILLFVLIANIGTTASEFSGISSSLNIISKDLGVTSPFLNSIIPIIGIVAAGIIAWLTIVKGTYRSIEKMLLLMVVFYFAYIVSAILAKPDWTEAFKGLVVPTLRLDGPFLFTTVGIIGTTITPWMYFYLQATTIEKGVKKEELKYNQIDTTVGGISTNIFAFFMIVACAATLFANNIPVERVSDIGIALQPFAGKYASLIFAFGLFNASLFGAFILPTTTAYIICEALGWELGINKKFKEAPQFYIIFTALLVIGIITVAIPGMPLLMIMRISQVANGIILPLFLFYLMRIAEDKNVMAEYATRGFWRIFGWVCIGLISILNIALLLQPFLLRD